MIQDPILEIVQHKIKVSIVLLTNSIVIINLKMKNGPLKYSQILRSQEEAYISVSKVTRELKFICNLLDSHYTPNHKPNKIKIDNVRAFFITP
jgi:hypothetical protein